MSSLFYNLGKQVGPKIRKAKWAYLAATAPEAEVLQAEYATGFDMAHQLRKQLSPCPDINQWINEIADPLIHSLRKNPRTFSYEAVHASDPQAFCLPGGFIFVSDSMVHRCDRDTDQVAFILAHEMAHIIEGHVMERMLGNALVKTIMHCGHLHAAVAGSLGRLGPHFFERAYSQENELRAHTFAVRLIKAAGYDPAGAIDLFLHLEPLQTDPFLGKYFSTHPSCKVRIKNIEDMIKDI